MRNIHQIFPNLLANAGNLPHELNKYVNVRAYDPYKGATINPEERRITS